MLKVQTTTMRSFDFNPQMFKPLTTGRKIDGFFSADNGIMPGTCTVVAGSPGVGKTTVLLDIIADLKTKGKKVLYISGEMNRIDMVGYCKRYPKFKELEILFMGDYADECPLKVCEEVLAEGSYDCVVVDSLAELASFYVEIHGGTYKGATSRFLSVFEKHNLGENNKNVNTAFLIIQQVTKSGSFAGSNKIKHLATAMMEIQFDKETGDRYLQFTKNRRGGNANKLYYSLNTVNQVNYTYEG
jgi:DNA repair protein RadA/Sms